MGWDGVVGRAVWGGWVERQWIRGEYDMLVNTRSEGGLRHVGQYALRGKYRRLSKSELATSRPPLSDCETIRRRQTTVLLMRQC